MDLEPNIINHEMLEVAIKEQSKQGEVMRLSEENQFDFNSVYKLRLEFQSMNLCPVFSVQMIITVSYNFSRYFKNRSSLDAEELNKIVVEL